MTSKDKAEETLINADNTILVTSMSTTRSSLKEGYNVLPDANETINVTDLSDAQMEESKLLNKGFFDFLRSYDSKRLINNIYSHHKAKVINKTLKNNNAKDNAEEDKIQNKMLEDSGRDKMEYEKLVGNTKLNVATTTMQNINIVIYSLPHSLLSPNIFSVYVIQVSQSYVTLWNMHSKSESD